MAFIDMVEWKPQTNDIFAWRFPEDNLSTATQLVVRESQEAVLFSKGQILGKFGPGKHTLSSENLPLLRNLFGIPFGGKNPFTSEVWFVNKVSSLTSEWKTSSMRFMDPDYGQMIPIVAKGNYGLKVKDAEKFLVKLVGTLNSFTARDLTEHFNGPLISKTNSSILQFMTANGVGINMIAGYLDNLSNFMREPLAQFWDEYGFELVGFYITSVDLDTSTPDGKKISDALSDRSAQNIAGYTWQQKQSFGAVNNAVNHSNGGIGLFGAAMMMGGGYGGNSGLGQQVMTPPQGANAFGRMGGQPNNFGGAPAGGMGGGNGMGNVREVFCSRCSKKFPSTSRFCPFCGDPYNPCPVCGADNDTTAKRCSTCGASLATVNNIAGMMQNTVCPRCGTAYAPGTKFCQNCGNRLS